MLNKKPNDIKLITCHGCLSLQKFHLKEGYNLVFLGEIGKLNYIDYIDLLELYNLILKNKFSVDKLYNYNLTNQNTILDKDNFYYHY